MEDGFTFDLSAAAWRHSVADEKAYVQALAVRLEQALPDKVRVERERRFFSKEELVRVIEAEFDTSVYRLRFDKTHGITTEKAKVVRGIQLRTDPMPFEEWLEALSQELTECAKSHENVRASLERFLFS